MFSSVVFMAGFRLRTILCKLICFGTFSFALQFTSESVDDTLSPVILRFVDSRVSGGTPSHTQHYVVPRVGKQDK